MVKISKDALVRIFSFAIAFLLALGAFACLSSYKLTLAKRSLEYSYLRSIGDLSLSLDNIKNTLNKGLYSNSPDMINELSSKLWGDAMGAKAMLSQLPIEELNLENTNKFLSQVGNYAQSLSKKMSEGESLADDEKKNLEALYSYAKNISDSMWSVESQIHGGYLTFDKVKDMAMNTSNKENSQSPQNIANGFADIEKGFDNYPTLIYDGPFSDHLMQRDPRLLKGTRPIDEQTALKKAVETSKIENLRLIGEEMGTMPSYTFMDGNSTVSVTKSGGFLCYMLAYRNVGDATISTEKCIEIAKKYMMDLGVYEVINTYYETQQGACIINFAGIQDNTVLYTDLIKVGVAMDNGEVISFDARGYITNHIERQIPKIKVSHTEAIKKLSPYLTVKESRMCIVPSDGLSEKYCYEFHCTAKDGQQILVYINAETGREEQLLILQIDEHGMLTV